MDSGWSNPSTTGIIGLGKVKYIIGPRAFLRAIQPISPEFAPTTSPLVATVPVANATLLSRFYPTAQLKSCPITDKHPKALLGESASLGSIQAHYALQVNLPKDLNIQKKKNSKQDSRVPHDVGTGRKPLPSTLFQILWGWGPYFLIFITTAKHSAVATFAIIYPVFVQVTIKKFGNAKSRFPG